jgi:hypothetical protein
MGHVKTLVSFTTRFARGTEGAEESLMQALTGYGETTISGHLHPSGIQVLATPRDSEASCKEASVCVRNRISTVPDTVAFLLRGALLCDLCVSSLACGGTGGRFSTSFVIDLLTLAVYIIYRWLCTELFSEHRAAVHRNQFGYLTLRIVKIAEIPCLSRARLNARG